MSPKLFPKLYWLRLISSLLVVGLAWCAVGELQSRFPKAHVDKKYLKPPESLKYFTFGYNDFLASSLWIQLLQNFDYCEGGKYSESDYVTPEVKGRSDKIDAIVARAIKPPKCHKGWVYSMLDVISEIQPHFHLVYDTGAMFLSVVVDDREGARLIFEKGLKYYPKDWQLNYHAGYHYLWEIQEPKRAAELFKVAGENGAPAWAVALSAALYTKTGQARLAKTILENALRNNPKGKDEERIKTRLKEVDQILYQ
jgi:tetratricopeptide (TPR) repeat protein